MFIREDIGFSNANIKDIYMHITRITSLIEYIVISVVSHGF